MSVNQSGRGAAPTGSLPLDASVQTLPGIGPKRVDILAAIGVRTLGDLLLRLPRTYQDRSRIQPIADAVEGENITIEAKVTRARALLLPGRKDMALLELDDGTGSIKATFFGRGFLARTALKPGTRALFTGRVGEYKGLTLQNPEYEPIPEEEGDALLHTGRIVSLYALTEGVTQRMMRWWVRAALDAVQERMPETLPERLRILHRFPERAKAFQDVHFPASMEDAETARRRFAYEELLVMQLGILRRRALQVDVASGFQHPMDGPLLARFKNSLPFPLTPGQRRAVADILADMASPRPMFRLIQGDVGSGKTVVALHAVVAAADGGSQAAFMAPTEILAEQHHATIQRLLASTAVSVALLTGATPDAKRVRQALAQGEIQVVVGTHALLQESTEFHRLGLVVIDEQHRFGVRQREYLARKGVRPDVLHATATPIPRTLAITLYGGMDISVIPDLPPGRKPVSTALVPDRKKTDLYRYLRDQAAAGFQSYIVCPLVEESEHFAGLTPLIDHYLELTQGPLAGLRCELLHGRLDPREKEAIMARFQAQEIDVLFATTVIEVGVDSPRATTIVIEDAGRFGLTQLHQLRGRVGRGDTQSHCFLLGAPTTPEGRERINILRRCHSGFEIAEEDLRLRGPGDYCGARQAGLPDFRVADLVAHRDSLENARQDAINLLNEDPKLTSPEHRTLAQGLVAMGDMFV